MRYQRKIYQISNEKKIYKGGIPKISNSIFKNHCKSDYKMLRVEKKEEPSREKAQAEWNLNRMQ